MELGLPSRRHPGCFLDSADALEGRLSAPRNRTWRKICWVPRLVPLAEQSSLCLLWRPEWPVARDTPLFLTTPDAPAGGSGLQPGLCWQLLWLGSPDSESELQGGFAASAFPEKWKEPLPEWLVPDKLIPAKQWR